MGLYTRTMSQTGATPLVFDRAGIRMLDQRAQTQYGMSGLELMERAAVGATAIARTLLKPGASVLIACGSGNNGGDGWAMARLLHVQEYAVQVWAPAHARASTDAAVNEGRARALGIAVSNSPHLSDAALNAALVIDALLGTGLDSLLRQDAINHIEAINAHGSPVLAIDLPSGMHADSGLGQPVAVRAHATATFAGLKIGMLQPHAARYTGTVHVVDIGIPPELARALTVAASDT